MPTGGGQPDERNFVMFPIFNFRRGPDSREIEAGVRTALEEHEREKRNKVIENRIAEDNARKVNKIKSTPRRPIAYDEVESVIAMVINDAMLLNTSSILLEKTGRIVNTLEEMLHLMAKVERLQKIVDGPQFTQDGELRTFYGMPLDEAADAILNYEKALAYIPRNCKTCRFNPGRELEAEACLHCGVYSTEDGMCRWEWNKR